MIARVKRRCQHLGTPRPPRIDFPDALNHVTSRRNGQSVIFHSEADRQRFLVQLANGTPDLTRSFSTMYTTCDPPSPTALAATTKGWGDLVSDYLGAKRSRPKRFR